MADINKLKNVNRGNFVEAWFNDRADGTKARHPDFDKMFELHHKLIFWWAARIADKVGGKPRDYLGTLVLRFNNVLYGYQAEKGTISTYFSNQIFSYIYTHFLRFESEANMIKYYVTRSTSESIKNTNINHAFHEADNHLYRIPEEDDEWAAEIINNFDTPEKCFEFLINQLDERSKFIITKRFREDQTLDEVGQQLKITKERVRQLQTNALGKISKRLRHLEQFTHLFKADCKPS